MFVYVQVTDGEFVVYGPEAAGKRFAPTREGLREMAQAFEVMGSPKSVTCSSSVDFCHEYGMPFGFQAHEFLGVALALAVEGLIGEMDDDEEVVAHVNRVLPVVNDASHLTEVITEVVGQ